MELGGGICGPSWETAYYKDLVGNGGKSGCGGVVLFSKKENIFAYNGNMITNEDYNSTYYEYNKDGARTENILHVYERKNLDGNMIKFIPIKIFAQSGIIRETYTTNQGEFTLSKVKTGDLLPEIAKNYDDVRVVIATNETETDVINYTNLLTPELPNQGIGSGAGYLEASNGSFKPIT